MSANSLKMMREKLLKGKQESQAVQQQNNSSAENNVQKVEKQKQQQLIAQVHVLPRSQPEQQTVNKTISQSIVPKQTQQIMKNTQLYQKLMSLKIKQKKLSEPILQKYPEKVVKPVAQTVKQHIPVTKQNNQEVKTQVKNKESSLKLMMQKLKKSKSEVNQITLKPQQKSLSQIQPQKQATIKPNEQKKSVELNIEEVASPQAVNQQHQPLIKSSSALDQGQKFPWAKSVNIPICQSNVSNQNNGKSQNPVEEILEIIKKTSQQNLLENQAQLEEEDVEQPEENIEQPISNVEQPVQNVQQPVQNVQQAKLGQPNNLQPQEEQAILDPPFAYQERNIENKPQEGIVATLLVQNSQQEAQPQTEREAQPEIQRELKPVQQRQPEQQISIQVQPFQTIQGQEKQKPKQESKVMQKLNTMMENLRRMKEMKENKNKQATESSKPITNNQVQDSANKNEVEQINQVVNVSKAEESAANYEDFQEQQKLEEQEQEQEQEQEEGEQEKEVIEPQQKVSKTQQKRTKIFLKQIAKLGEITHKIQSIINQKHESHKINQNTSSGLVDLFRKIQVSIKND